MACCIHSPRLLHINLTLILIEFAEVKLRSCLVLIVARDIPLAKLIHVRLGHHGGHPDGKVFSLFGNGSAWGRRR